MSDIKIPGVNSDAALMIEKLMKVERIPLEKMENELTKITDDKKVWQSLIRTTTEFQNASKSLYGFQNPFSEHLAESSKPDIVTAIASRDATIEDIDLIIKQKATGDRFISNSLPRDYRVNPGTYKFQIGDEEISLRYRGGKLEDFAKRLNEKDDTLLRASVIRNRADSQVILIESVKTGASNSLFFLEDSIPFALESGILQNAKGASGDIPITENAIKNRGETGTYKFINNNLVIKSGANFSLPLNSPLPISDGAILEIEYYVKNIPESDYTTPPPPGPDIPDVPGVSFKEIRIDSSDYSFNKPEWEVPAPPLRVDDMNVFFVETDSGITNLPPIEDFTTLQKIQIPMDNNANIFKSLNINNNNNYRDIILHSAKISNPSIRGDYEAVNPLDNASDAIILMNGIEIVRDTNKIDDLIPGLTLNIHSSNPDKVTLNIKPDTEHAKDQLINFVFKYNELVTRLLILTNSDNRNTALIDEKEGYSNEEREQAIEQLGLFRGEYSLVRLKNSLQTIMASPFETSAGSGLTLLKQLGISTNESNSGRGATDISRLRGYLEINEETLDQALFDNQKAIKDLFGKDTDGDLIIDSGIGKKLDEQLAAYTQTGGFFSTKISRIAFDIDNKEDDIEDYKEKLISYEQNLKRKYGNMESMLNQLESSSQGIDNFNNQNNNNK